MTFSEALDAAMSGEAGLCQIGEAIASMDPATDAVDANVAVVDPDVPDRVLAEAITQTVGFVVDLSALASHRRHACTCILGGGE